MFPPYEFISEYAQQTIIQQKYSTVFTRINN